MPFLCNEINFLEIFLNDVIQPSNLYPSLIVYKVGIVLVFGKLSTNIVKQHNISIQTFYAIA